jgi:GABA permease
MNAVVLIAVLSCLNSGLYTASRILFVLAARQEAPARLRKLSPRGVPYLAVLSSSAVGFVGIIMARMAPDTVFTFLLNSSGAVVLFVYLLITLSQIVLRHRTSPETLRVKMWFFPILSVLALGGIVTVLVQMALNDVVRSQLWFGLLSWGVVLALYFVVQRRQRDPVRPTTEQTPIAQPDWGLVLAATEPLSIAELHGDLRGLRDPRRSDARSRVAVHS